MPSAMHELMCAIAQRYPETVVALAKAFGVPLPEHDRVQAAPNSQHMKGNKTLYTDVAVHLVGRDGKVAGFAGIEVQRNYTADKYATLHAYHGSEVRNVRAGGHLLTLCDKESDAAAFRREDAARRAQYAFAASFHSARDLAEALGGEDQPLPIRVVASLHALTRGELAGARELLAELALADQTVADLFLRTTMEEVPDMTMLGEQLLRPEMLERLRELESFREYEARTLAAANAQASAQADARVAEVNAEADARVAAARVQAYAEAYAQADARVAAAKAQTDAEVDDRVAKSVAKSTAQVVAGNLLDFLTLRGDNPSEHAITTISNCHSEPVISVWLKRAYRGETSAEIFPEP